MPWSSVRRNVRLKLLFPLVVSLLLLGSSTAHTGLALIKEDH